MSFQNCVNFARSTIYQSYAFVPTHLKPVSLESPDSIFVGWNHPVNPDNDSSEEAKKIVLSRLKNYIEYIVDLGDSPVVLVGCSIKNEKLFKHKVSCCYKGERKANFRLCTFNFTAKLNDFGYYIPLLAYPCQIKNNGCARHSCTTC